LVQKAALWIICRWRPEYRKGELLASPKTAVCRPVILMCSGEITGTLDVASAFMADGSELSGESQGVNLSFVNLLAGQRLAAAIG